MKSGKSRNFASGCVLPGNSRIPVFFSQSYETTGRPSRFNNLVVFLLIDKCTVGTSMCATTASFIRATIAYSRSIKTTPYASESRIWRTARDLRANCKLERCLSTRCTYKHPVPHRRRAYKFERDDSLRILIFWTMSKFHNFHQITFFFTIKSTKILTSNCNMFFYSPSQSWNWNSDCNVRNPRNGREILSPYLATPYTYWLKFLKCYKHWLE